MYVCMYACISAGCIAVTLTAGAKYIDGRSSKRSKGASQLAYIVQLLLLVSNCCGINSFITRLEVTHCTFGKSRQNCRWLATVTCPLSTIRHFLTSVNCVCQLLSIAQRAFFLSYFQSILFLLKLFHQATSKCCII